MSWTIVRHAPLSMGFPRQEYWSALPFLSPGYLPDPGVKPTSFMSPELTGRFFTISTTWEAPPKWKWKSLRGVRLFATPWTIDSPWNSPGQNTRVGRLSLLQGIFPTQGSRPRLPHCRRILYQLSYQGSPKIHISLFSRSVMSVETPWTSACQASLSITNSWSLLKLISIELVMSSNYLILCQPLLLPPSIFPNIRVFSNELVLLTRWSKYWSFSSNISSSKGYLGLISWFPVHLRKFIIHNKS